MDETFFFRSGTNDEEIFRNVHIHNEYHLPERLKAEDIVIDIGMHIGSFSYAALKRGSRKIYAFEPSSDNFACAERNLRSYINAIHMQRVAVWRSDLPDDVLALSRIDNNRSGASLIWSRSDIVVEKEEVRSTSLDSILLRLTKQGKRRIKFLKIDCEGSEFPILLTSRHLDCVDNIAGEFHEMGGDYDPIKIPPHFHIPGFERFTVAEIVEYLSGNDFKVIFVREGSTNRGNFWAKRISTRQKIVAQLRNHWRKHPHTPGIMSRRNELGTKPGLSVGILAWNAENRLPDLLSHVRGFADEIVVGVDAASTDGTFEVANSYADVVFRFQHTGVSGPAHMLLLDYVSRDWLLVLDSDERMDERFASIIPELLESDQYTHYLFSRKLVVSLQPPRYVRGSPWFPDWQLRLFRNDRSLVWHNGGVHAQYQVMGLGCYETRTSILHFERLAISEEERAAKLQRYREHGSKLVTDRFDYPIDGRICELLDLPRGLESKPSQARISTRVIPGILKVMAEGSLPPWGAALRVDMPREFNPGEQVFADATASNRGRLAWFQLGREPWPILNLSYHILDESERVILRDGDRTPILRVVNPGATASFLASFTAPNEPGKYLIEWDMVSEGECWFAQCNSSTLKVPITVKRQQ